MFFAFFAYLFTIDFSFLFSHLNLEIRLFHCKLLHLLGSKFEEKELQMNCIQHQNFANDSHSSFHPQNESFLDVFTLKVFTKVMMKIVSFLKKILLFSCNILGRFHWSQVLFHGRSQRTFLGVKLGISPKGCFTLKIFSEKLLTGVLLNHIHAHEITLK